MNVKHEHFVTVIFLSISAIFLSVSAIFFQFQRYFFQFQCKFCMRTVPHTNLMYSGESDEVVSKSARPRLCDTNNASFPEHTFKRLAGMEVEEYTTLATDRNHIHTIKKPTSSYD